MGHMKGQGAGRALQGFERRKENDVEHPMSDMDMAQCRKLDSNTARGCRCTSTAEMPLSWEPKVGGTLIRNVCTKRLPVG